MLLFFIFKLAKVPRVKLSIGSDHRSQTSAKHAVDLDASKPLISAIGPYNLHYISIVFRDGGIVRSPSLLISQSITNLVWNRCMSAPYNTT